MAQLQKPSVSDVRGQQKEKVSAVKATATEARDAAAATYGETVTQLTTKKTGMLAEVAAATDVAIQASAETVTARQDAVKAAQAALTAAQQDLAAAQKDHKTNKNNLLGAFNQAASDIRTAIDLEAAEAKKARDAVHAEHKANVAKAKKEGRSETWAEAKATLAYDVYVVKDTVVRVVHGVVAVGQALGQAFKTGFEADTNVKVPESVAKRQPPAGPSA